MLNIKKLVRSFRCALSGIRYLLRGQNFVIEVFFGFLVMIMALVLEVSHFELVAIMLIVLLILILEIINTIFERIVDILQPRLHPFARIIKDMMAGAVLIACIGAVAIGYVIFGHYLFAATFFI